MMCLLLFSHRDDKISCLNVESTSFLKLLSLEKFISLFLCGLSLLEELSISFAVAACLLSLANLNELDLEDQSRIWRDRVSSATLSVCVLWRQLQLSLLSYSHRCDTNVPSLDDLALTDFELERFFVVEILVKNLAV
jgi:hypothetical protein